MEQLLNEELFQITFDGWSFDRSFEGFFSILSSRRFQIS
jgi:hypothetical protein